MYNVALRKFFLRIVVWYLGRTLKKRAGVDIQKLDVTKSVVDTYVPALFIHGEQDRLINKHHSELLHRNYGGSKNIVLFEGDHNSARPNYIYDSISIFFSEIFRLGSGSSHDERVEPPARGSRENDDANRRLLNSTPPYPSESERERETCEHPKREFHQSRHMTPSCADVDDLGDVSEGEMSTRVLACALRSGEVDGHTPMSSSRAFKSEAGLGDVMAVSGIEGVDNDAEENGYHSDSSCSSSAFADASDRLIDC